MEQGWKEASSEVGSGEVGGTKKVCSFLMFYDTIQLSKEKENEDE